MFFIQSSLRGNRWDRSVTPYQISILATLTLESIHGFGIFILIAKQSFLQSFTNCGRKRTVICQRDFAYKQMRCNNIFLHTNQVNMRGMSRKSQYTVNCHNQSCRFADPIFYCNQAFKTHPLCYNSNKNPGNSLKFDFIFFTPC